MGSRPGGTQGRCCLRACQSDDAQLVDTWEGWDVYTLREPNDNSIQDIPFSCDLFFPTVTFPGFGPQPGYPTCEYGAAASFPQPNSNFRYTVGARQTAGTLDIKYEVFVSASERLLCSIANDV